MGHQLFPHLDLMEVTGGSRLRVGRGPGTFPGPAPDTSVPLSSSEGHLVARCYFLFPHLQTLFLRSDPPLFVPG